MHRPPMNREPCIRPERRPYTPPRLMVYGSLRELTLKNGGTMGMNDGGAGPDKTQF
jgi:hypothetical protein